MPTCSPYMETLAAYVQKLGGGAAAEDLLGDLNSFLKTFACSEQGPLRTLGSEYI